jgi:hypothetical protein
MDHRVKPGGDDVGVTPMVTMTARNEASLRASAKQSRAACAEAGLLRRYAPRNDESWHHALQPREGRTDATKTERAGVALSTAHDLEAMERADRERHAHLAQAQCTLLEYWRDCAHARCRRAQRCLVPYPCFWERKQAMTAAEHAEAERACRPLRALLSLGSLKGAEGLWLF